VGLLYGLTIIWIGFYIGTLAHELGHYLSAKRLTCLWPTTLELFGLLGFRLPKEHPMVKLALVAYHGRVCVSGDPDQPPPSVGRKNWRDASRLDRALFALGGPALQGLVALVSLLTLRFVLSERAGFPVVAGYIVAWAQLAIAVGNLVPGPRSDGGHVLRSMLDMPVDGDHWTLGRVPMWFGRSAVIALASYVIFAVSIHFGRMAP